MKTSYHPIQSPLYYWKWFVKPAMLAAKDNNVPFCPIK